MTENSTTKNWHAIYTRSKCEKVVYERLQKFCEPYLPMHKVQRQWSDRIKTLHLPLISCYVFAYMSSDQRFETFRDPNIISILSRNGKPLKIPEKEIELLRRIELSRTPFQFTQHHYAFSIGDKTIFNSGPLYGQEAYIEKIYNDTWVYVRVPTLGGFFKAKLKTLSPDISTLSEEVKEKASYKSSLTY